MGMEANDPLPFAVGIIGNVVSILVYLVPSMTFYRIYKKKSTGEYQCLPYMVALFSSMLWLFYAYIRKNVILLVTINSSGTIIESIYIAIFLVYAPRPTRILTIKILLALNVVLYLALVLFSIFLTKGALRVQVFGWICVTVAALVFAAPLSILVRVYKTKSVEYMPIHLSIFLSVGAIAWFLYGFLVHDWCVAIPNVFGFTLGVVQMVVYACYRNAKKVGGVEEEMKVGDVKDAFAMGPELVEPNENPTKDIIPENKDDSPV
ncbi:hypothetical protein MLD38_004299 [Melastoma candidum]|uniref:Uncharacterized protein n=1 Tax=Melastoma candidum TaxID=119954 RepID=A0ACB9S6T2_9MYRT|nr:hypothetical protein MLD38_004299 [Melastoma candidum]